VSHSCGVLLPAQALSRSIVMVAQARTMAQNKGWMQRAPRCAARCMHAHVCQHVQGTVCRAAGNYLLGEGGATKHT
jgi:hypothetical protein